MELALRTDYVRLLRRADRLGGALADSTNAYCSQELGELELLAVIQCVFGVRAWRAVRAVRQLIKLRTDDQIGILARHLYELATNVEYISTTTERVQGESKRELRPADKMELFREYYWIEMHKSGYESPPADELDAARDRRRKLGIKDSQAWHGATVLKLCEELDGKAIQRGAQAVRVDNYKGVYKSLSNMFVHPSFRNSPWLDLDSQGYLRVLQSWESNELLGIAAFYSAVVMGFWNRALGYPKRRMAHRLLVDAASSTRE